MVGPVGGLPANGIRCRGRQKPQKETAFATALETTSATAFETASATVFETVFETAFETHRADRG